MEMVVKTITEHVTEYVVSSTKYVNNMRKEMEILDKMWADVRHQMENNILQDLEIPARVPGWLDDVESLKEEFHIISSERIGYLNMKMRYITAKKALMVTKIIKDLCQSNPLVEFEDAQIPLRRINSRRVPSATSKPLFPSRERPFNDALKFLQQDDNICQVIALCGPGGVGKTTMMEQLKEVAQDTKMFDILKEEEKEIVLLCSLFPEDFDIPIEDLTRHVWGLKLFKQVSTILKARHKTMTCVQNLIHAKFLIRSDDHGCVKMHDRVLAFVLGGVSRGVHPWIINHGHRLKLDRYEMEHCKRISLTCTGMSRFPSDFKYPNLSLLQPMDGDLLLKFQEDLLLKFQEDFYDHKNKLEVIAYYNMQDPLLPRSLPHLTTLCLYECGLKSDYSFLGGLVNLQVLSLAGCGISKLARTIGNLSKLKLLDVTGCVDLLIDDGVFCNLKNLEELYIRVSDGKAIRFTDANLEELQMLSEKLFALEVEFVEKQQLNNLSFKKLEKFKISMGCLLDTYSFNNTLKIVTDNSTEPHDCHIGELFNKTENLHLQVEDMIRLEDVSHVPYRKHSFINLRDLEVCKCVELKHLFPVSVASGLRRLERLKVSSCFVLETLVDDDGRENKNEVLKIDFKELRFLCLEKLPEMGSLLPDNIVVELPKLVELEVDGLPIFTSIYSYKKNDSSLLNSQVGNLKLKKLRIKSMKNLKHIWAVSSEEEVNGNATLEEIYVEECNSLVELFPTNPMRLLTHLEELSVRNCASIGMIFNLDLDCIGHELSNSSLRVIKVCGLENVRVLWQIKVGEYNSNKIIWFTGVESIRIRECKKFRHVFTPTHAIVYMEALANIDIYDCGERGRNKQLKRASVDAPEVIEDKFNLASLLSIHLPSSPNKISNLNLGNSPLKVVFEISNATTQNQDAQQQTTLFPYLKDLCLSHMERMTHVWDGDNSISLLNRSSFNNLTTIYLYQCKKIKYLFSPLMAKLLCNLEKIHLDACDAMEQVVSNSADKDKEIMTTSASTSTASTSTSASTATFFPNLHSLTFNFLISLRSIGAGGVHDEFKVSQVNVVCSSLFHNSREIHISWCDGLSEIFESQGITNNSCSNSSTENDEGTGGIHNTSLAVSKIQNINVPQLYNLKKLVITYCGGLQHVFTFSTLESLRGLQELEIKECEAMKVIVKEENEEQRKDVEFPNLKSLELSELQNLEGFFMGTNRFNWPSLQKVMISKCPKLVVFTLGRSTASKLKYMHTSLGKHHVECGLNFNLNRDLHQTSSPSLGSTSVEKLPWSFHNLIELHIPSNYDPEMKCIIPSNELLQLQKLEIIRLDWCFHVNEVFEVKTMEGTNIVKIPNLRHVELSNLEDLMYIWNGDTPVFMFPNLTTISIDHCENLKHVFTSAMVGSLQQLQDLHVSTCSNMEVILKVGDSEKIHVTLPCLKSLKLKELQNLTGFWSRNDEITWPLLLSVDIKECPKLIYYPKVPNGKSVTTPRYLMEDL